MRATIVLMMFVLLPAVAGAKGREGVTNMTFSAGHGTQIEYLAANGASYLWYPGNEAVVRGQWRSQAGVSEQTAICFAYQQNSYNPVTGNAGGSWECEPSVIYTHKIVDRRSGDPFGLARAATVPFPLDPQRTTLEALLHRS